jgi:magnesium transporter
MGAVKSFIYNKDILEEIDFAPEKKADEWDEKVTIWANVNLNGPKDEIEKVFKRIDSHPLVQKGILEKTKRPKFQDFEDAIVLQVNSINHYKGTLEFGSIRFILGEKFLVTFQENKEDPFDSVREKIRKKKGLIREKGPDFLMYHLLEAIIDDYIDLIDELEEKEFIPTKTLQDWNPNPESMTRLEKMNQKLYDIKASIRPLIESVEIIEKGLSNLIRDHNRKYFLDLKQQSQFLINSIESFEHRLESSINLFFTMQGHHMNQVMKTLTIVSSIFIPLTFIAGIYGMNFLNMPELNTKYGYFVILGVMLATVIGMMLFLRKRKWF